MGVRLKVAVADDEVDTREYLQDYFAYLGHEVRVAADGRHLVELCREFEPDVVVTDFAMPGLDGLAAAAEVVRARPVPVVLISGRHDAAALAVARGVAVTFLAKPVNEEDLRAAVEAVLAGAGPASRP